MEAIGRKSRSFRRCAAALLCAAFLPFGGAGLAEPAEAIRLEAEDGTMTGAVKAASAGGIGWAEGFKSESDTVAVRLTVTEEGAYDVTAILASMDGGHKENPVLLDGKRVGTVVIEGRDWGRSTLENVYFTAGEHTLGLGTSWGWVKLDALELTPAAPLPSDLYTVEPVLATPDPMPEAQRLFNWLCEIYGKKIISGQVSDGMYGLEMQAVWRATGGKYPALLGLDMMDYTPSRVERGGAGHSVDAAIEYWNQGGLVTYCWHWNAPSPYLDSDRWYSGFYTQYTTFNLAKALNGEDPAGYDLLMKDIDAIAAQLGRLRDAGVPVLWRPLHEASGSWFWWGASGADAYLKLYRLLFDRLTNEYGLNNLIWIWNGQDAAWYPGDDVVDIIGIDIYPGERVYESQSASFLECVKVTDARKIVVLSENGCVPDSELVFRDGTVWGWWCTWGGEYVIKSSKFNNPSEQYTEKWLLKKVYDDERVVTRGDIPDFRSGAEE